MSSDAAAPAAPEAAPRLLRIQEVAAETGLTPRSIRYYEEMGLLAPAGRSEGAYRLYDADDLERLRFIAGLRNDAGFSLAEIGMLLEDEEARARNRVQFRAGTEDEQRAALADALARVDRQIATLERKRGRLDAMLADAAARRAHLQSHADDLDEGRDPAHGPHVGALAPESGPEARR
jgi:MerR family transcriptional regulator, repressor of the yfmOP operon